MNRSEQSHQGRQIVNGTIFLKLRMDAIWWILRRTQITFQIYIYNLFVWNNIFHNVINITYDNPNIINTRVATLFDLTELVFYSFRTGYNVF